MPRDYAKCITCVNLFHHNPLRQVLALSSLFLDKNVGTGGQQLIQVIQLVGGRIGIHTQAASFPESYLDITTLCCLPCRKMAVVILVKGPVLVQGISSLHILPSYAQMLLEGQNFHCAVLILLLAQLVQRGEASLIPASLLAGLASFDFPIYRCQEFSFEFSPSCLSMLFISSKKIKFSSF